LTELSLTPL